ncbi:hypothetical protein HY642_05050 [Candidatus Woesearchaeota archaeon]|nr:hypothetical protein [Candidatus Woesearchaeota archaeon]
MDYSKKIGFEFIHRQAPEDERYVSYKVCASGGELEERLYLGSGTNNLYIRASPPGSRPNGVIIEDKALGLELRVRQDANDKPVATPSLPDDDAAGLLDWARLKLAEMKIEYGIDALLEKYDIVRMAQSAILKA